MRWAWRRVLVGLDHLNIWHLKQGKEAFVLVGYTFEEVPYALSLSD